MLSTYERCARPTWIAVLDPSLGHRCHAGVPRAGSLGRTRKPGPGDLADARLCRADALCLGRVRRPRRSQLRGQRSAFGGLPGARFGAGLRGAGLSGLASLLPAPNACARPGCSGRLGRRRRGPGRCGRGCGQRGGGGRPRALLQRGAGDRATDADVGGVAGPSAQASGAPDRRSARPGQRGRPCLAGCDAATAGRDRR